MYRSHGSYVQIESCPTRSIYQVPQSAPLIGLPHHRYQSQPGVFFPSMPQQPHRCLPRLPPEGETQTSSMAHHKGSAKHVFDFLVLPRELRDMVYDCHELLEPRYYPEECIVYLGDHKKDPVVDQMLLVKPCTSLLLVCRQIHQEYQSSPSCMKKLFIKDYDEFRDFIYQLPHGAAQCEALELHLYTSRSVERHQGIDEKEPGVPGCDIKDEINRHLGWIKPVVGQMAALESIELKVTLPPHELVEDCYNALIKHFDFYTSVDKVKSIEVFTCKDMLTHLDYGWMPWKSLAQWHRSEGVIRKILGVVVEDDIHELYPEWNKETEEEWCAVQAARMASRKHFPRTQQLARLYCNQSAVLKAFGISADGDSSFLHRPSKEENIEGSYSVRSAKGWPRESNEWYSACFSEVQGTKAS